MNSIYDCYGDYFYLVLAVKCKKIISIHNLNSWFRSNIRLPLRKILDPWYKAAMIRSSDGINVFDEKLKNYVLANFNYRKNIFTIPFQIYNALPHREHLLSNDNVVKFIVSGLIQKERRDCGMVLDVFKELFKEHGNISLTLAGPPVGSYGMDIVKKCKEMMGRDNAPIKLYDRFITGKEFDDVMSSADILIDPQMMEVYCDNTKEIYGMTKNPGNISDLIRFAKPGIFPQNISVPGELEDSILRYGDAHELKALILKIIEDREFLRKLSRKAMANSEKYSLRRVRDKTAVQIKGIFL